MISPALLSDFYPPSLSQVFEAMIAWIKYDKPARLEHMPKLMEHVRLPLLSRDYLVQVKENLCSALLSLPVLSLFKRQHFPNLTASPASVSR